MATVAPADSNRGGCGGDGAIEVSGVEGRFRRLSGHAGRNVSECRAGVEEGNAKADKMKTESRRKIERLLSPALVLLMLGGLRAQKLPYATPADADPYHRRVRQAVERIPQTIGDWVGTDVEVRRDAERLLRPNIICNRFYRNKSNGQGVSLSLVHCRDARDMGRHYPPICYRAHGWEQRQERPVVCRMDADTTIEAAEYEFRKWRSAWWETIWVVNVLLLPDGTVTTDISVVGAAAADYRTHFFGAGQVQLIFRERISAADRDKIFETFMNAIKPVIEAIGSGVEG